jgi:hypothetical protein
MTKTQPQPQSRVFTMPVVRELAPAVEPSAAAATW